VVSSTPRPHFTPGKDTVPIVQEAGWASGPVWTGGKSRPHRDSIPDRPARSSVAIPTELPGQEQETDSKNDRDLNLQIHVPYVTKIISNRHNRNLTKCNSRQCNARKAR